MIYLFFKTGANAVYLDSLQSRFFSDWLFRRLLVRTLLIGYWLKWSSQQRRAE